METKTINKSVNNTIKDLNDYNLKELIRIRDKINSLIKYELIGRGLVSDDEVYNQLNPIQKGLVNEGLKDINDFIGCGDSFGSGDDYQGIEENQDYNTLENQFIETIQEIVERFNIDKDDIIDIINDRVDFD